MKHVCIETEDESDNIRVRYENFVSSLGSSNYKTDSDSSDEEPSVKDSEKTSNKSSNKEELGNTF